jgi:L-threonylcarbamoyladenylate synthase
MSASRPHLQILRPTEANLARLASVLRRGEIVGVPSETVYGLAANALSEQACAKIFAAKGRPTTDPLIVHLASAKELSSVAHVNETALTLARSLWPGPLTLVLSKTNEVPDIVTAGKPTVAVRIPAHPLFRKLIRLAGCPLAAPSANPFGYVSPTAAAHVRDGLAGSKLRYVLDGGECRVGVESTIIDLVDPRRPRVLRPGGLAVEAIEAVIGLKIERPRPTRLRKNISAPAPGMLARHYSPSTPILLHERIDQKALLRLPPTETALLLRRPTWHAAEGRVFWLSDGGRLEDIARNLFSLLRQLDTGAWQRIHAEFPTGTEGLAPAIRDRLTRAAARR